MKCKTVQSDKKWNASEEKENKKTRRQEVETKKSIAFSGALSSIVPLVVSKLQKNSVMLSVAFVNSFVFHVIPCHLPVSHHNLELQGNYIRRLFRLISVFKLCAGNNCHKQKHSFYILNATQFDVRPNFWRHVFQLITLRN